MGDAAEDRAKAAKLPEGDVIRLLFEQHAQIRDLFNEVKMAKGDARQDVFDDLRTLLAVHETAEEMILRPVTGGAGGQEVADARNQEEAEANEVLAELEKMDLASTDFEARLVAFEKTVDAHAEAEENEEFPIVLANCSEEERKSLGTRMKAAEAVAPTHPHPSTAGSTAAQMAVGPFASIVDRVRDAISGSGS